MHYAWMMVFQILLGLLMQNMNALNPFFIRLFINCVVHKNLKSIIYATWWNILCTIRWLKFENSRIFGALWIILNTTYNLNISSLITQTCVLFCDIPFLQHAVMFHPCAYSYHSIWNYVFWAVMFSSISKRVPTLWFALSMFWKTSLMGVFLCLRN